ncbi:sensor histidine kinase [Cellulophaga baltica]|uniref:sensor histidine kinase n=1 Tax=Cellulophaga baltica TaxID=76594 RepID=UPI0021480100|nr:sensor histidine kinase [Cellulophaga baltica]MCR1024773.1 sensor histidine kinase [Cellulophaga baltica]
MYNVTSLVTLFSCIVITLFSGGINSAFIFVLGLVVFAGYVTTKRYGEVYLYSAFIIVTLIYFQSILSLPFVRNVVPEASQDLFNFISILFSLYILGGVFGKILVKTHYNLYRSKLEVEQKVREKETLIKEVHHRVKNNLQTVSSLLSLQARNMKDEEMKKMIKSSQNRVNSMAMVHEMLYMREDLSKIEYKSYVEELSDYLVRSIKGTDNRIKVAIDIIDINLGIDTAIPLGLLINEAITNSLKYGIKDNGEGEISIALKKSQDEKDYVLNIGDNGDGYEESITPQTTTSLGLKLIYNLTRQLQGSILKDGSKKGTNYIITFKEIGQNFQPIG